MLFGIRKLSVDFRHLQVFAFCHRAYSKTRNPRKNLFLLLFDVRFFRFSWNFPPFPWFPAFPAVPGNRPGPFIRLKFHWLISCFYLFIFFLIFHNQSLFILVKQMSHSFDTPVINRCFLLVTPVIYFTAHLRFNYFSFLCFGAANISWSPFLL